MPVHTIALCGVEHSLLTRQQNLFHGSPFMVGQVSRPRRKVDVVERDTLRKKPLFQVTYAPHSLAATRIFTFFGVSEPPLSLSK